ncbi:outer membrane lipoprotein chaperone LolA [Cardiobacteriaceae bacterium TAE3-ERU3]|nr:outer membrane lipoprotein chaperone LolA [Cardiobacteriaceae bacterium TAE3-ERU3]
MRYKILSLMAATGLGLYTLPASAQLFNNMAGANSTSTSESTVEVNASDRSVGDASALAAYIDGSQSLSGQFEQIVYSNRGEDVSSGSFRLKRPGMFDWQYTEPSEQRIISNGTKVYHYDQDLEQITIRPRSELAGDIAMNLLVGDKKLLESFDVSAQPASKAPARLRSDEPGVTFYELKPKNSSDEIDQVWIVMLDGVITGVYVDTGVGQQSLIVLHDVKRNANIANNAFNFTPPAGVDVIGD